MTYPLQNEDVRLQNERIRRLVWLLQYFGDQGMTEDQPILRLMRRELDRSLFEGAPPQAAMPLASLQAVSGGQVARAPGLVTQSAPSSRKTA